MAVVVPIISTFDAKGINRALRDFKKLEGAGQRGAFAMLNTNKAVNTLGKNFAKFGAITAGVVGVIGGSFVKAAYESQKVMKQTDAILAATGNAAGLTSKDISDLSEKLSLQTGIDDELIQSNLNLLLTFKQVRNEVGAGNDIFNRAAQAALDMGNVLGSSEAATKQLGKALSNPVKGLAVLSKAGVTFTEQQKAQIKTLVASGKTLDAQKLILTEIEGRYKGTAAAGATAFDKMKVAVGNVQEEIGGLLLPVVEQFANFVVSSVVPVMSEFSSIVGRDGIGAGINYLTGSLINGIAGMGAFGKTVLAGALAFGALKVAVLTYTGVQKLAAIATELTTNKLRIQAIEANATKVAMAAAGVAAGVLAVATIAYGVYASRKAEAAKTTTDLANALLAEKSAQTQLLTDLYSNDKAARRFIDTQNTLGLTTDDLAQYINNGTGKVAKYANAWATADGSVKGIFPKLNALRTELGLGASTTTHYLSDIREFVKEINKLKTAQDKQAATQALINKLTGYTAEETTTTTTVVETAAEKFKKFADAARSVTTTQKSQRDAIKATGDAQKKLQKTTDALAVAQANFNQIVKGYGAASQQAIDKQKELAAAQREAKRAAFALEKAQFAVGDAERALQDAYKAGDPEGIREAEIALEEAKLDVVDAQIAATDAADAATLAQTTLNETISGATKDSQTYKDALQQLTTATDEQADAVDAVRNAKERELQVTRDLAKATILLRKAKGGLTKAQLKEANKLLKQLSEPVTVTTPTPSAAAAAAVSASGLNLSSLDLSGLSINVAGLTALASGGIVQKPTVALIGEGGESEAVVPLSKMSEMGGMGGGNTYITVQVTSADPNAVVDALRRYQRQNGALPVRVAG